MAAAGSDAADPGWSDLPSDLLVSVVELLELPAALAFGAVCASWRSAVMAAGGAAQSRRPPWLVSMATHSVLQRDPAVASKFRSLLNSETITEVSFPNGLQAAVACCGASHGWLVMANELSDLVLFNPFTAALVALPPITGFAACAKSGDEVSIMVMGYRYRRFVPGDQAEVYRAMSLGACFYDKVVLSGSPSRDGGGTIAAMAIHMDGKRLSFARVGDRSWRDAPAIRSWSENCYADGVFHGGMFYTVTMAGAVNSWDLGRSPGHQPRKRTIVAERMKDGNFFNIITRYLVPTPWGDLLQLRVLLLLDMAPNHVSVEIYRLDLERRRMVKLRPAAALQGHAAFVGQNSSRCLPAAELQLKPDSIYFTTPRLRDNVVFHHRRNEWKGVMVYDLKERKLETAFMSGGGKYGTEYPSEVWFVPNLR